MSVLGDILAGAISAVAAIEGGTVVEYRAGNSGAWTALANSVFHERGIVNEYDDQRDTEYETYTATLVAPLSSTALSRGYQVRIASATIWSVREVVTSVGSRQYRLSRKVADEYGPDRGATT